MLSLKKNAHESWSECIVRYAKPYGLEEDVKRDFHKFVNKGICEENAAYYACEEWDILDYEED